MVKTIKKYIKFNLLWLKLAGLWTDSADFFATQYYWKYSVLVNVFFVGTFNLCLVVNLITTFDDLEKLASSAYVVLSCVQASVKAMFYVKNWDLVKHIVEQLDQKEFQPKNAQQQRIAFNFMKVHIGVHVMYSFLLIMLPPLWLSVPLMMKSVDKVLPFPAWYPYDWRKGYNYQLSYIHQAIGLTYVCFDNFCMDLFSWIAFVYIGVECDILSDTLRNLHEFAQKKLLATGIRMEILKQEQVSEEMNKILISCVQHHWKILKYAKDTNTFFSVLIFALFSSTVLTLCMTLFQLTLLLPGSFEFIVIGFYQLAVLIEILLNCWFGNEVIVKSSKISSALYESRWLDCPPVFKQNMRFVMLATQKSIQIYGINFFVLSLSTFMAILRAGWSVFAMLAQVHKKDVE